MGPDMERRMGMVMLLGMGLRMGLLHGTEYGAEAWNWVCDRT